MNADKEIPLENEIQICLAYLSIMQMRYEDKLTYRIAVDPCLYQCQIPSLSLQTLVENAVKHGCEKSRGNVHIDLVSALSPNGYLIQISDNGPGIEPDKLCEINAKLQNSIGTEEIPSGMSDFQDAKPQGSIGLINICRRLLLKFGKDARIQIDSALGTGTTITLHIPERQTGEDTPCTIY